MDPKGHTATSALATTWEAPSINGAPNEGVETNNTIPLKEPLNSMIGKRESTNGVYPLAFSFLEKEVYRKRVFAIRLNTTLHLNGTTMHITSIDKTKLVATCQCGVVTTETPLFFAIEGEQGETLVFSTNIRTAKIKSRALNWYDIPLMVNSYDPSKIEDLKVCYLVVRTSVFEGRQRIEKVWGKRVRKDEDSFARSMKIKPGSVSDDTHDAYESILTPEDDQSELFSAPDEATFQQALQDKLIDTPSLPQELKDVETPAPPNKYVVDVMEYIKCPQLEWLYKLVLESKGSVVPENTIDT